MANDFTANPILIDTAIASPYVPAAGEIRLPLHISKIIWFAPESIDDTVVVHNAQDRLKWQAICEVAGGTQVHNFIPPLKIGGLQVPTIDSGLLMIYLDE